MLTRSHVLTIRKILPEWSYTPNYGILRSSPVPLSGLRKLLKTLIEDLSPDVQLTKGEWMLAWKDGQQYLQVEIGILSKKVHSLIDAGLCIENELHSLKSYDLREADEIPWAALSRSYAKNQNRKAERPDPSEPFKIKISLLRDYETFVHANSQETAIELLCDATAKGALKPTRQDIISTQVATNENPASGDSYVFLDVFEQVRVARFHFQEAPGDVR